MICGRGIAYSRSAVALKNKAAARRLLLASSDGRHEGLKP
jgi:hypothetical protein